MLINARDPRHWTYLRNLKKNRTLPLRPLHQLKIIIGMAGAQWILPLAAY